MTIRRVFVDTEWTDLPWSQVVGLLWIGLADEAGRQWAAVRAEAVLASPDSAYAADLMRFVTGDVPRLSDGEPAAGVRAFCAGVTAFWAWVPGLASFAGWSKLGASPEPVYRQCRDIDLRMLRAVVTPWPAAWPTVLMDLNAAASAAGAALPPRVPNHLHPPVHAEWNRQLFARIQACRAGNEAGRPVQAAPSIPGPPDQNRVDLA